MVLTFSLETSEPELGFGSFSYAAVFRPVKCPLEITYIGLLVTALDMLLPYQLLLSLDHRPAIAWSIVLSALSLRVKRVFAS